MPKENPLELIIGKNENGGDTVYRELFFEDYIKRALNTLKFHNGAWNLGNPVADMQEKSLTGFTRSSREYMGIVCMYKRLAKKGRYMGNGIFIPEKVEDMNDHTKITESASFNFGRICTVLSKGNYSILLKYTGGPVIAEEAIAESFKSFKKMAGLPEGRKLKTEKIPGGYILDFGSKKDNLSLVYEIAFMKELLDSYIIRLKQNR